MAELMCKGCGLRWVEVSHSDNQVIGRLNQGLHERSGSMCRWQAEGATCQLLPPPLSSSLW